MPTETAVAIDEKPDASERLSAISLGKAPRGSRTIQSVDRALDLIEVLADANGEIALKEIAIRSSLNLSTCHHLISTLVKRGYVGQNPQGRSYFLGPKILEISNSRMGQFNLAEVAMPELRRLNQITKESVHLAMLHGHDLTTLGKLESLHAVRVATDTGRKANAAHATATGKAILAWLPETEIARVVAEKGLSAFTEHTITSLGDLVEELRHVRRNGFALDREEFQPGVICVGSAIRDISGAVMGSISCSMPEMRATNEHVEATKHAVKACATTLSELLGRRTEKTE
ncbi:MAG: IclR family transcriptional regulator [Hyphomicrobiales bacterium]